MTSHPAQPSPSAPTDSPRLAPPRLRDAPGALWGVLLAVGLLHLPVCFTPFFIDDYVYIERVQDFTGETLRQVFTRAALDETASGTWWVPAGQLPFYRPAMQISIALDYAVWGLRPFGFHLTNVLLHLLCALLAWQIASLWLSPRRGALVTAMVLAMHPMHSEAVFWISGRFDLLVSAALMLAVVQYLRAMEARRRSQNGVAGLHLLGSLGWFGVGLLCKETAVLFPIAAMALDLSLRRGGGAWRGRIVAGASFLAIGVLYFAWRVRLFGALIGELPPPYGIDRSSIGSAVSDIFANLCAYMLDVALAVPVDAFFFSPFVRQQTWIYVPLVIVAAVICAAVCRIAWRSPALRIGAGWAALFTAPTLLAMPGERNLYLAMFGLALIAGAAGERLLTSAKSARRNRFVLVAILAVWIAALGVEQVVWNSVVGASEKSYRQLQEALPEPPVGSHIYIVSAAPFHSVGLGQAIRMKYGRSDLDGCVLSLAPRIFGGPADEVGGVSRDALRIERSGGTFFQSIPERFHLFGSTAAELPSRAARVGLTLLDAPRSLSDVSTLTLRLPHPLDDPRIHVFRWQGVPRVDPPALFDLPAHTGLRPIQLTATDSSNAAE